MKKVLVVGRQKIILVLGPVRRMPQREEPVFHPTYAVDENNYLLLTDYVQKLGKEIYYDLDQVLVNQHLVRFLTNI